MSTKALCAVEKGSKPLEFKWKFNGIEIQSTQSSVLINTYDDYSLLNIDPVSSLHGGNYTCIATNKYGKDTSTAVLLVQGKFLINIDITRLCDLYQMYELLYINSTQFLIVMNKKKNLKQFANCHFFS